MEKYRDPILEGIYVWTSAGASRGISALTTAIIAGGLSGKITKSVPL